jgi:hypothetical protein
MTAQTVRARVESVRVIDDNGYPKPDKVLLH